jgi:hypothetical protein
MRAKKTKQRSRPAQTYQQEVDTNVYKLTMATLKDGVEIASGDPVFCQNCQAAFSMFSKIEDTKDNEGNAQQVWSCEFCSFRNDVCFEEEELPKSQAINYILEAAAQVNDKKLMGKQEISVVFCIDISGSMCVS